MSPFILRRYASQSKYHRMGFGLDLTKRNLQSKLAKGLPWERAKAFDGAALFSPFAAAPKNLDKPVLELRIDTESPANEAVRHKCFIRLMSFLKSCSFPDIGRWGHHL